MPSCWRTELTVEIGVPSPLLANIARWLSPGRRPLYLATALIVCICSCALSTAAQSVATRASQAFRPAASQSPVDYVNPNIGGVGHLLTSVPPDVQRPHGVVQIAPVADAGVTDIYVAGKIYGFSAATWVLMAATGSPGDLASDYASEIDHDKEIVTPYYASYLLDRYDVHVEYTASKNCAYFRFHFPRGLPANLFVTSRGSAKYQVVSPTAFESTDDSSGVRTYLYTEFSKALLPPATFQPSKTAAGLLPSGEQPTGLTFTGDSHQDVLEARMGFSYIDAAQAKQNLRAQIPNWNFTAAKTQARSEWNDALSRIFVKGGGSVKQQTIFYTALYRSLQYMKDITEGDRYFGPYDHSVHQAAGRHFYIEDNLWDTYRSRHPLQTIIEPERQDDILRSYVIMYEQSGWMPHFPYMQGDLAYMIGNHAAALFADSYFKGFRDFDLQKAYEGLRKNAFEATMLPDRRQGVSELEKFYFEKGYFPALAKGQKEFVPEVNPEMRRQAVSVTLETSYDDWNIAQLARALGKTADAAYFAQRALNYRNVFNPATGFMAPRASDGTFVADFDPKWSGGQAGRDYFTECNSLVYSFQVQHDVAGLITLMGGGDKFIARLDDLFNDGFDGQLKFVFLSQFPDSTGLMGQYPQGNEPAFHIPYLYNYAGQPWKTQKRVRAIMRAWFSDEPLGIPGDDDNGAMSSWYVFSAMGFYPVSPGRPIYDIGSPIFNDIRINLGHGKFFRIVARQGSARNKYIQSAELNGQSLDHPWISHKDIAQGGFLIFHMGPNPNKQWGSKPSAAPPGRD